MRHLVGSSRRFGLIALVSVALFALTMLTMLALWRNTPATDRQKIGNSPAEFPPDPAEMQQSEDVSANQAPVQSSSDLAQPDRSQELAFPLEAIPEPDAQVVVEGLVTELLTSHQPDLPPETATLVAERIAAAISENIKAATTLERSHLIASVKTLGPEIGRLPYIRNDDHLEWSLNFLENKAREWAIHFDALTGPAADLLPADAEAAAQRTRFAQRYEGVIKELTDTTGPGVSIAGDMAENFRQTLEDAADNYFSPEGKFALTNEARARLDTELANAVERAAQRLDRRESAIWAMEGLSPAEREERLLNAQRSVLAPLTAPFYAAMAQSIPDAYRQVAVIPTDLEAATAQLSDRRRQLDAEAAEAEWAREREAHQREHALNMQRDLADGPGFESAAGGYTY